MTFVYSRRYEDFIHPTMTKPPEGIPKPNPTVSVTLTLTLTLIPALTVTRPPVL